MKRLSVGFSNFKHRLSGSIKFAPRFAPAPKVTIKEDTPEAKSMKNISDDNLKESQTLLEDIIFIHNYFGVRKLETPTKVDNPISMTFIQFDDLNQEQVLNDEEFENIKTEQILNILRPKIEKYLSYKDIEFNCTFMKNLYSYAEEIGFDNTLGCLFPLIQELTFKKDIKDNIILSFFEGLNKFIEFLLKEDTDHQIILGKILPVIDKILNTKKDFTILNRAILALKDILNVVTKDECKSDVLPLIISLANNEKNPNSKKLSIKIFNEIAKFLGSENIDLYVIPQLESITEDTNEDLRISCVNNIMNIFENISYQVFKTKMIRIYQKLSTDESVQIRQKCCEMLPQLCKLSRSELVSQYLLPIYCLFTNDQNETIRTCALSIFGEFSFYLQTEDVKTHTELLEFYISEIMNLYDCKKVLNDNTPLYKCAFSFPSVLLIYYRKVSTKKWNELKTVYMKFACDKDIKVRKTIAHSFAEVSKILDADTSENELSPLILTMYNTNPPEIQNIIVNILPDYLYSIKDNNIKLIFMELLKGNYEFLEKSKKWRDKISYLKVIGRLVNIYSNDILFKEIFNICLKCCFDKVNKVNIKAAKNLSKLLLQFLSSDDQYKVKAIVIVRMFATCVHYHYRQLFVYMCKKIIEDESIFLDTTIDLIEDLSYDNISNVKITLGQFLSKVWEKKQATFRWIHTNKRMLEIIYRLKNDEENEVKNCLNNIKLDDVKAGLKYDDYSKINMKKNVNETFTSTCEEVNALFGFTPIVFNKNNK